MRLALVSAVLGACVSLMAGAAEPSPAAVPADPWQVQVEGESRVVLYFFWSQHCPHCRNALPYVESLAQAHDWLQVRSLEVTANRPSLGLYVTLAERIGQQARSVPAFLFCGEMVTGFDDASGIGRYLETRLLACRDALAGGVSPELAEAPELAPPVPVLGRVDFSTWSLPLLTITLGTLDSFNPCAFFVLLFLLTRLLHAHSRPRMALVGGLFVVVSGVVYFLFMTAWLNLFILIGQLPWMTSAAGLVAILIGLVNVKDYVAFRRGLSLGIPESARPGLFARMRRLVAAERLPALVAGTLALAIVANAYELLCTAGFPMVFTRVLTLHDLAPGAYYGYLALYAAVYVMPLLVIVTIFVVTLGGRRLSEPEARSLKLLSGVMMLGLGLVLVAAPNLLGNVLVALGLLALAVLVTWSVRRLLPGPGS